MKNPISNKIYNHLEFLGYKVEDLSDEENIDRILGKNDLKSNLLFIITNNNMIHISVGLFLSKSNKIIKDKFLKVLNSVNSGSLFSKWHYVEHENGEIDIQVNRLLLDYSYDRQSFSKILDLFEKEISEYTKEFFEFSD